MTLNEAWKAKPNDGVFSYFAVGDVPFPLDNQNALKWNMMYHFNHSGLKITSPLVDALLVDGILTPESKQTLADSIILMFKDKWTKIFNAFTMEYNPIENYNSKETETYTDTSNGSVNSSITDSGSNGSTVEVVGSESSNTSNTNRTQTSGTNKTTSTSSNTAGRWGFNSTESNPTDKNDQSGSNETLDSSTLSAEASSNLSTNNSGTTTTTGTNSNSRVGEDSHEDHKQGNRTLLRSGNIGVTTSQQMIESELELRMHNLMNTVFGDIDTILTIAFYKEA